MKYLDSISLAASLLLFCLVVRGVELELAKDGKPIIPLPQTCRYYRTLLTLDGGGLRGLLSTQILKRLSDEIKTELLEHTRLLTLVNSSFRYTSVNDFHVDLADYFDAVAGISAGSWIAAYIASKGGSRKQSEKIFSNPKIRLVYGDIRPGSVEGLDVFFIHFASVIYPFPIPPVAIKPRFWRASQLKIAYMTKPMHPVQGLDATLKLFLGDTLLSEVATSLLIVAYDLNFRAAVQFTLDRVDTLQELERVRRIVDVTKRLANCTRELRKLGEEEEESSMTLAQTIEKCRNDSDVQEAVKGLGRYGSIHSRMPVIKRVTVGRVSSVVRPRYEDDICDYVHPGMTFTTDLDYKLRELARSSSAFPMIQEANLLRSVNDRGYDRLLIDGAMVGNNPTLQAWVWMSNKTFVDLKRIATFSVGTGTVQQNLAWIGDGGYIDWMLPTMGILLDTTSEFWQSNLDFLFYRSLKAVTLPNQFLRIQADAEKPALAATALTLVDQPIFLRMYKRIGKETANRYSANIKAFVKDFVFARCNHPEIKKVQMKILREVILAHKKTAAEFHTVSAATGPPPPPPHRN